MCTHFLSSFQNGKNHFHSNSVNQSCLSSDLRRLWMLSAPPGLFLPLSPSCLFPPELMACLCWVSVTLGILHARSNRGQDLHKGDVWRNESSSDWASEDIPYILHPGNIKMSHHCTGGNEWHLCSRYCRPLPKSEERNIVRETSHNSYYFYAALEHYLEKSIETYKA